MNTREQYISINKFVSISNVTAASCTYLEEIRNDEIYLVFLFKDSISQQSYVRKVYSTENKYYRKGT